MSTIGLYLLQNKRLFNNPYLPTENHILNGFKMVFNERSSPGEKFVFSKGSHKFINRTCEFLLLLTH